MAGQQGSLSDQMAALRKRVDRREKRRHDDRQERAVSGRLLGPLACTDVAGFCGLPASLLLIAHLNSLCGLHFH
jgi:hypothetical protein